MVPKTASGNPAFDSEGVQVSIAFGQHLTRYEFKHGHTDRIDICRHLTHYEFKHLTRDEFKHCTKAASTGVGI